MKKITALVVVCVLILTACGSKKSDEKKADEKPTENAPKFLFGYNLDLFEVHESEIKKGQTFGNILDKHHVWNTEIYKIANAIKPDLDVRRLRAGKNYTILANKDSIQKAQVFIYQHDLVNYSIVDFRDSIFVKKHKKKITTKIKSTSGVITSNLSTCLDQKHINVSLAHKLSDIYAWTIDFFRLQKNDKFKIVYEEKFIEDSISVGIGEIKTAYFEHVNKPFYAFNYITDSKTGIKDYFDDNGKNLRRAFLKAPLNFSRISSRYNLKRKIALYGKVKPHLGTDFAAPVGSPIMTTANGTVIASKYKRGNGNYVKVKHNSTYTTQYLHMKSRKVKVGDYVKQGDVIGWVGMTGYTSGPHVCYRFWKNGKQVDPLRQKLPAAKPMKPEIKEKYLSYIAPLKKELDAIIY